MACLTPIAVENILHGHIYVPCSRCPNCKRRRINSWVFRLLQEEKISSNAHFVTLTYDTKHVPISKNGFMTLEKSAFQNYMKRLRKLVKQQFPNNQSLKYYAAGEYGSKNDRPHYHAIIFNVPHADLLALAWTLEKKALGTVDIGTVTGNSIAYTAKYIDKPCNIPRFKRDDRLPVFSLMSKGLGKNYIEDQKNLNYHRQHLDQLYLTKIGGHKIAMPRYYRDKIWNEEERKSQIKIVKKAVEQDKLKLQIARKKAGYDPDVFEGVQTIEVFRKFEKSVKNNRQL